MKTGCRSSSFNRKKYEQQCHRSLIWEIASPHPTHQVMMKVILNAGRTSSPSIGASGGTSASSNDRSISSQGDFECEDSPGNALMKDDDGGPPAIEGSSPSATDFSSMPSNAGFEIFDTSMMSNFIHRAIVHASKCLCPINLTVVNKQHGAVIGMS